MDVLSGAKWSSHLLLLNAYLQASPASSTACVCEYPTHTHPPTLPLTGLITDSFDKLRNKGEASKEDMQVCDLHSATSDN